MRIRCFLHCSFFLFFLPCILPAQQLPGDTITVHLKRSMGIGPLQAELQFPRKISSESIGLLGIPHDLDTLAFWQISLHREQEIYSAFLENEILTESWELNKDLLEIDTPRLLSNNPNQHIIYCLSGFSGREKILICDANQNFDLSDDNRFAFDTLRRKEPFQFDLELGHHRAPKHSAIQLVNFTYFDGKESQHTDVILQFLPFVPGILTEIDSNSLDPFLFAYKKLEHRSGSFHFQGKDYNLFLDQAFPDAKFYPNLSRVFVVEQGIPFHASLNSESLKAGDLILLDNQGLRIDTIDPWGNYVLMIYEGFFAESPTQSTAPKN